MMPIQALSQRMIVTAAIAVTAFLVSIIFLYETHTPSTAAFAAGSVMTVVSSGSSADNAPSTTTTAPAQSELHIADNGLVLLRGVRVVSISGSTIHAQSAWGHSDFTWELITGPATKFFTSKGEKETLSDIAVGDIVTVTGMLDQQGGDPIVDTEFVRE